MQFACRSTEMREHTIENHRARNNHFGAEWREPGSGLALMPVPLGKPPGDRMDEVGSQNVSVNGLHC